MQDQEKSDYQLADEQLNNASHSSKQMYDQAIATVEEGMVLQLADGRIQACNASAESILGLTSEQIQGWTFLNSSWQFIHEDGSPLSAEAHPAMVVWNTGQPCLNFVVGLYRPNGELIWLLMNSQPLFLACETAPYAVVSTFSDITQRKLVDETDRLMRMVAIDLDINECRHIETEREEMLVRSQQYASQLHGLTEAALKINSTLSIEEVIRLITEQARAIIGAHQSVTSMTIESSWAQSISSISLSDKYAAWRDYHEKPDGLGIYASFCQTNRPMRMTQAELELHPRWRGFSKEAEKHPPMRGWLAAPLIGRNGRNIGLIQLSDKYEGEFTEEDEAIIVQLAQMASIAIENTRLYSAEQQARTLAEEANGIKDEFLAVLSHELRSPLNPILGWSKLLQSRKFDATKTAAALATIERNAKLQAQLIEDLLDVSRILQGKLTLNVGRVNLVSTIAAAQETVRLAAEAKSIEMKLSLVPEDEQIDPTFLVMGDPNRLQQVIWNLLSNAVKFTPPGGKVEVRLKNVDSCAQIEVIDTGKGINPNFLPYVFDYFRQGDSATTRKFGGLGLGLAIVQQIVELHGGTVLAASSGEGQGAIFTVNLPLRHAANAQENRPKDDEINSNLGNLQGFKILVVDDDTDSRDFISFVLSEEGAEVTAVPSAMKALQSLAESKPDILLSDIGMPDMDGYMLIRQVRTWLPEQGGQIPAIALTAYAGEYNQQQALSAGFQMHVTKPAEPSELVTAVVKLADKKVNG